MVFVFTDWLISLCIIFSQTDSDQRGGGRGIMVERRGRDSSKDMYE